VRLRSICFGHVIIAVYQGRRRRDAVAAREEQRGTFTAGQSKYYRLYVGSGKLVLTAMCLWRVGVVGRTFAAALTHVSTAATPPAPAAKQLGVGLQWPCRGQTCGDMLEAMARIAPARMAR
jgi:hypothetical protein